MSFSNEILLRLHRRRQNLGTVQTVMADDELLRLAQHPLLVPAVGIGGGDEKATDQRGADHGYGAYVNGSKSAFHLAI